MGQEVSHARRTTTATLALRSCSARAARPLRSRTPLLGIALPSQPFARQSGTDCGERIAAAGQRSAPSTSADHPRQFPDQWNSGLHSTGVAFGD